MRLQVVISSGEVFVQRLLVLESIVGKIKHFWNNSDKNVYYISEKHKCER